MSDKLSLNEVLLLTEAETDDVQQMIECVKGRSAKISDEIESLRDSFVFCARKLDDLEKELGGTTPIWRVGRDGKQILMSPFRLAKLHQYHIKRNSQRCKDLDTVVKAVQNQIKTVEESVESQMNLNYRMIMNMQEETKALFSLVQTEAKLNTALEKRVAELEVALAALTSQNSTTP